MFTKMTASKDSVKSTDKPAAGAMANLHPQHPMAKAIAGKIAAKSGHPTPGGGSNDHDVDDCN